jgi:hypothetical protein
MCVLTCVSDSDARRERKLAGTCAPVAALALAAAAVLPVVAVAAGRAGPCTTGLAGASAVEGSLKPVLLAVVALPAAAGRCRGRGGLAAGVTALLGAMRLLLWWLLPEAAGT